MSRRRRFLNGEKIPLNQPLTMPELARAIDYARSVRHLQRNLEARERTLNKHILFCLEGPGKTTPTCTLARLGMYATDLLPAHLREQFVRRQDESAAARSLRQQLELLDEKIAEAIEASPLAKRVAELEAELELLRD